MTCEDRVQVVAALGFTERQARFLVTVALHGGFCLKRQYVALAGVSPRGQAVQAFWARLVAQKYASQFVFGRNRGAVYHLRPGHLYEAMGETPARHRGRPSPAVIARKIMLLDHVLGERGALWYATAPEKVTLFSERFGVPLSSMPQRIRRTRPGGDVSQTRYFPHGLPIRLAGDAPVPTFAFLVVDTTGAACAQFLKDHRELFITLPRWQVVAVAPRHIPGLRAAAAAFTRYGQKLDQPRSREEYAALEEYFRLRDRVERNDLARITQDMVRRFQDGGRRFATPEFQQLYEPWKQAGGAVLERHDADAWVAAVRDGRGIFTPVELPLRYDEFGTRAGVT